MELGAPERPRSYPEGARALSSWNDALNQVRPVFAAARLTQITNIFSAAFGGSRLGFNLTNHTWPIPTLNICECWRSRGFEYQVLWKIYWIETSPGRNRERSDWIAHCLYMCTRTRTMQFNDVNIHSKGTIRLLSKKIILQLMFLASCVESEDGIYFISLLKVTGFVICLGQDS